jgi:hypothetical protein
MPSTERSSPPTATPTSVMSNTGEGGQQPSPLLTPREVAMAAGEKTYLDPGRPCKHDYASLRYVTSGGCVECVKGQSLAIRSAMWSWT